MRMRVLLIISTLVISIAGMTQAAEGRLDRKPIEITAQGLTQPSNPQVTRIFVLRHYPVSELVNILEVVTRDARLAIDEVSNRLIVTGPQSELKEIGDLVQALDVEKAQDAQSQPMICRAYMFELLSQSQGLKRFSVEVLGASPLATEQVLNTEGNAQLKIENFYQRQSGGNWELGFEGRAASNEVIKGLLEKVPACEVQRLDWSEDLPVMPMTKVPPLPEKLQKHVDRFLGQGAGIVGYWFGSMSVPGSVRAPIGPWTFSFEVEPSGQEGQLRLDLNVGERRGDDMWEIISNTIQGKVGRPVIIGYNRDNRGVQTMGALVIIPEVVTDLD